MSESYPLSWPTGWPRIEPSRRKRAKFSTKERHYSSTSNYSWTSNKELTIAEATQRVLNQLHALGAITALSVISSNLELRNDGLPRSGQRQPEDPGIAVYWKRNGESQKVMAIDIYDRVADNLAAVAATLEAMRAIERHGGAQVLERAFTGFVALSDRPHWATTLGISPRAGRAEVDAAFRRLAAQHHPDRPGGSHDKMAEITTARDQAHKDIAA